MPKMVFPEPTCTLLFILTLSLLALYTTLHHRPCSRPSSTAAKTYANVFLSTASNYTVAAYLRHLTLRPHLVGTPLSFSTALYVQSQFQSFGLTNHITNFSALLSYPTHSSLSAHFSNASVLPLPLSEPNLPDNGVVLPYHAYSPSGTARSRGIQFHLPWSWVISDRGAFNRPRKRGVAACAWKKVDEILSCLEAGEFFFTNL